MRTGFVPNGNAIHDGWEKTLVVKYRLDPKWNGTVLQALKQLVRDCESGRELDKDQVVVTMVDGKGGEYA